MSALFEPYRIREVEFRNRIFVSPMCQYSSENGFPTQWHLVHLGTRAIGGAGLVVVEATAVNPEGRITFWDSGIWSDEHAKSFGVIANFLRSHGSVPGIQLAHAGRKASTDAPWRGGKVIAEGPYSWTTVAPSAIPFREGEPVPHELTKEEIGKIVHDFAAAARRSLDAGFEVIELHFAHGYLVHQFLSPLSNSRSDEYGGSLENRMRFALEIARAARDAWPSRLPLFVRISASDWADGGWNADESVVLCRELKALGVDLIDCSSGGLVAHAKVEIGPGYQVPFAEKIRNEVGIATGAVGLITEARQAEEIVSTGKADAVFMARQLLRDPYFPLHAAKELGVDVRWPDQYLRSKS